MQEPITLHIAELAACVGPQEMVTNGIGSCIVIVLVDKDAKIGGMAHAILPTRRVGLATLDEVAEETRSRPYPIKYAKFADEAVAILLEEVIRMGANRSRIIAKLVGGARMFKLLESSSIGLGKSNIESARSALLSLGIPIENEVTGGGIGRNVRFNPSTGIVEVMTKV